MVNNDQRIMVDNGQMMVDNEGLYPTIVGHIMFNDDWCQIQVSIDHIWWCAVNIGGISVDLPRGMPGMLRGDM